MTVVSRRELVNGEHDGICYDLLYADMDELRSIADVCKAKKNEGLWHLGKDKGPEMQMRVLAEFPDVIVEQYCADRGITLNEWIVNPEHCRAMLKDPALRDFTIHPGGR